MTKRENYNAIKELVKDNADFVAFIEKEIAALDAKAGTAKAKRTAKSAEAAVEIREMATKALEDAGRPITLPELVGAMDGAYTAAKVTYYIRDLIDNGVIVKEKAKVGDRKIMTYKLA